VQRDFEDVSQVSLDRDTRRLVIITAGRRIELEDIDRLYVDSMPWNEASGSVYLKHGRVSVNGNVAAAKR
jgi:hypothetical protein